MPCPQLLDLVSQIDIRSELPIYHPLYPPSEVSPDITARFHRLPPDLRHDYLSLNLRNYLYDIYYSGELQPLAVEAAAPLRVLKNNAIRGVDADFYAQLSAANQGTGYFDPHWQVVKQEAEGQWAVKKEGLTVQIDPSRHLQAADRLAAVGDCVAILLPHNRMETGYYLAVGNAGLGAADQTLLEVCFNFSAEGAIATLHALTTLLNAHALPFSFKVWLDPDSYQRYDAGVLHIGRHHYATVKPLLEQVYAAVRSHLQPETPLFTKALAPGVGLAEEPQPEAQDFGLHRCQVVADALLALEEQEERSPTARLAAIQQGFVAEGIDPQRPYLNPNADDIYTPLGCPP